MKTTPIHESLFAGAIGAAIAGAALPGLLFHQNRTVFGFAAACLGSVVFCTSDPERLGRRTRRPRSCGQPQSRRAISQVDGVRRDAQRPSGAQRFIGAEIAGEPRMRSTGDQHPDARARAEPVGDRVQLDRNCAGNRCATAVPVADVA
jgi:hypothetical protein